MNNMNNNNRRNSGNYNPNNPNNNNNNRRNPPNNRNVNNNRNNINRNQPRNQNAEQNRNYNGNYNNYSNNYNYNSFTIRNPQPVKQRPRKKRRRSRIPFLIKYAFRFFLFLLFFAVIGGVSALLFFFGLTGLKSNPDILYTVNTIEIKNNEPTTVSSPISLSYETGFKNEQYYFPVNDIMEKMEFILVGDKKEFSFVRSKSDEYIKFICDSNIVYINDEKFHLSAPVFSDKNNILYVPVEFLKNNFENLNFSFDEKNKNNITIDFGDVGESCFKIRKAKQLEEAKEIDAPYFSSEPVKFISDLSEYEKYFNPPAENIDEYVILINQTHPLDPQDYAPPDLVDVKDTRPDGRAIQQLRLYPEMALRAFLIEARANGHTNVTVTSAYRGFDLQTQLFNNEVATMRPVHGDNAEAMAATSVAYPGQSEHQSGLCLDMHSYSAAAQNFGNEPDGKWLAENAHYFGFIIRYPQDKTEITGIKYEPWHFRYVGRYHATRIYDLGLSLEEYWDLYLKK